MLTLGGIRVDRPRRVKKLMVEILDSASYA